MKTKYIWMSLLLLLHTGCQDETFISNTQGNEIKVYATTGNTDTRISFTEGDGVTYASWNEGDRIGLLTSSQNNLLYEASTTAEGKTEFTTWGEKLQAAEGDTVYAYYPNTGMPADNQNMTVALAMGSHAVGTDEIEPLLYASGIVQNNELKLQFKHACAYLKLTITADFMKKMGSETKINEISLNSPTPILYQPQQDVNFNLKDGSFISEYLGYEMPISDGHDFSSSDLTLYVAILPQSENARLSLYASFASDKESRLLLNRKVPTGGMKAGHVYTLNTDREDILPIETEMREALIAFYKATDGDNWNNNTNWCSDKPITEWYGISKPWDRNSYFIELGYNNLTADLSECLKLLYGLPISNISLIENNITGSIPKDIDKLEGVNYLHLGQNDISGEIPAEICDLESLEILNLGITKISGGIPQNIGRLKNLNDLGLANTNLSGELPESLCELTKLVYFSVNITEPGKIGGITGEIPQNIGNLVNLSFLLLGNNQLTGNLPASMSKLTQCLECTLHGNKLNGHIPSEVSESPMFVDWLPTILKQQDGYELTFDGLYKSTDFSKDKEVVVLQKHTEGNGIPIILMGDTYTDKDMESGGLYETTMKNIMEGLFSKEPTKSLRHLFDVYCVKAVSIENYIGGNTALGAYYDGHTDLGCDYDKCFEYARLVRENLANVPIVVALNKERINTNVCHLLQDRTSITVVAAKQEHLAGTVLHETIGHGLAYLGDEYWMHVVGPMTEEQKQQFRKEQEETGWALNIDVTSDPEQVHWSKFIKDPRYKDENIGIYEGGLGMYQFGVYRSTEWSIMNAAENWQNFNAPSREIIYKRIMQLAYGDSWTYDYETFVEWDLAHYPTTSTTRTVTRPEGNDWMKNHRPPVIINRTSAEILKEKN